METSFATGKELVLQRIVMGKQKVVNVVRGVKTQVFSDVPFVEETSWRPWHFDFGDPEFGGLLSAEKLWMFCHLGNLSGQLMKLCGDMSQTVPRFIQFFNRSSRQQSCLQWCVVGPGETIYLPYGVAHSMFSLCSSGPCRIVTVELPPRAEAVGQVYRKTSQHNKTGTRRDK